MQVSAACIRCMVDRQEERMQKTLCAHGKLYRLRCNESC